MITVCVCHPWNSLVSSHATKDGVTCKSVLNPKEYGNRRCLFVATAIGFQTDESAERERCYLNIFL